MTPDLAEAVDFFLAERARMAATALHTAAYANGQTVLVKVKDKATEPTRDELAEEVASLLRQQGRLCALTRYAFKDGEVNPHLRKTLDRINSNRGLRPGKPAGGHQSSKFLQDCQRQSRLGLKARAKERMAAAMQGERKISVDRSTPLQVAVTMANAQVASGKGTASKARC